MNSLACSCTHCRKLCNTFRYKSWEIIGNRQERGAHFFVARLSSAPSRGPAPPARGVAAKRRRSLAHARSSGLRRAARARRTALRALALRAFHSRNAACFYSLAVVAFVRVRPAAVARRSPRERFSPPAKRARDALRRPQRKRVRRRQKNKRELGQLASRAKKNLAASAPQR
jgi:hypothetical protein